MPFSLTARSLQEVAREDPAVANLVEWLRDMEQAAECLAGVQESAAAYPADFARLYTWPWPEHMRRGGAGEEVAEGAAQKGAAAAASVSPGAAGAMGVAVTASSPATTDRSRLEH